MAVVHGARSANWSSRAWPQRSPYTSHCCTSPTPRWHARSACWRAERVSIRRSPHSIERGAVPGSPALTPPAAARRHRASDQCLLDWTARGELSIPSQAHQLSNSAETTADMRNRRATLTARRRSRLSGLRASRAARHIFMGSSGPGQRWTNLPFGARTHGCGSRLDDGRSRSPSARHTCGLLHHCIAGWLSGHDPPPERPSGADSRASAPDRRAPGFAPHGE